MDLQRAAALAREIMDAHGLQAWAFGFDRGRRRAGACHHSTRTITLSKVLTSLYDEADVRGVILHEVAHALVGARHGHDKVWRDKARAIGASPDRRLGPGLPAPPAPWVGTCPVCGATKMLFRSPQRVVSCGVCSPSFDARRLLQWTYMGRPRTPGVAYRRELARLRRARLLP